MLGIIFGVLGVGIIIFGLCVPCIIQEKIDPLYEEENLDELQQLLTKYEPSKD